MSSSVHGPLVVRRRLGALLKRLRAQVGLPLDVVARRLEISPSKLSRLETGHVAPRIRDVRDLLDIYDTPAETRDRAMRWAEEAKQPGWWQPFSASSPRDLDLYISLEAEASRISMYSHPISGLLQTEAYARMLLSGAAPNCSPEALEDLVSIRMRRQDVLNPDRSEAPPVRLHAVLDEAALHRGAGADVLRGQLRELLTRSEWPNVELQVLPFTAGFTAASGTFAIFEPRNASDRAVAQAEGTGQDAYFDTEGDVARFRAIWSDVLDHCLDVERSRQLIRQLARG